MRKLVLCTVVLLACLSGHCHSSSPTVRALPVFVHRGEPVRGRGREPDPNVVRCQETMADRGWKAMLECIQAQHPKLPVDAGADAERHMLGAIRPGPTASWTIPVWHINVSSGDNENTGADAAHPVHDYDEVVARWGTEAPLLAQNTTIFQDFPDAVNPPTGLKFIRWRVTNGAVVGWQNAWTQACTGTFSNVTQLVRNSGGVDTPLHSTLCAGLTQPTLITDTTINCDMWADTNTSGNDWDLTHYLGNGATFIPPSGGSDQLCSIANGHSFTAFVPIASNIRLWAPEVADLADLPDSRATLYGGELCKGINTGAGTDTAQCRIVMNNAVALNEVAFQSSTSIEQTSFTHGSRAFGYAQNVFAEDNSARMAINGLGGSTDIGSSGLATKAMAFNGGRLYSPRMTNVQLYNDLRLVTGGTIYGAMVYGNLWSNGMLSLQAGAFVQPNGSSGGIYYGTNSGVSIMGPGTFQCNSPANTNCPGRFGLQLDGAFDGYAFDDSTSPGRDFVHITLLGNTLGNALDTSIAGGGCGGRCIGRSKTAVATLLNAIPSSPLPLFTCEAGITCAGCNTPGSQCNLAGSGTGPSIFRANHAGSPYTLTTAQLLDWVDVSGGVVTLNLPSAPPDATTLTVTNSAGSASTNNITVTRGGSDVLQDPNNPSGATVTSAVLSITGATVQWRYGATEAKWSLQ